MKLSRELVAHATSVRFFLLFQLLVPNIFSKISNSRLFCPTPSGNCRSKPKQHCVEILLSPCYMFGQALREFGWSWDQFDEVEDRRLGECYRRTRKSCSVFRFRVRGDVSCARSFGSEICLRCWGVGVFGIRVLLLMMLLFSCASLLRWCPAVVPFSFSCLFIFTVFYFLLFSSSSNFPFLSASDLFVMPECQFDPHETKRPLLPSPRSHLEVETMKLVQSGHKKLETARQPHETTPDASRLFFYQFFQASSATSARSGGQRH